MSNNKRPETMARITTKALADAFIEEQVKEIQKQAPVISDGNLEHAFKDLLAGIMYGIPSILIIIFSLFVLLSNYFESPATLALTFLGFGSLVIIPSPK